MGKMPRISTFNGDPTQKEEVVFEQWAFEVRSVMQSQLQHCKRNGKVFMQSHS